MQPSVPPPGAFSLTRERPTKGPHLSNIVPLSVAQPESQRSWLAERIPLVHTEGNRVFATSKDVASYLEKRHDNVLQPIDDLFRTVP